jgi:hypothetical protein
MEPSGRNRSQPVATRRAETAQIGEFHCRGLRPVAALSARKEEVESDFAPPRATQRRRHLSRAYEALSTKTRFRGPLVAQTLAGRLAQPCEAEAPSEQKSPANEPDPRRSSLSVAVPDSACHAGGRGFESRRSRKSPCKSAYCVVMPDARIGLTTQTVVRVGSKRAKTARKAVRV